MTKEELEPHLTKEEYERVFCVRPFFDEFMLSLRVYKGSNLCGTIRVKTIDEAKSFIKKLI